MTRKAVLIQPGKLGDIIICAPIAKHYSEMGYEVYWPVFDNFYDVVSRFDYVIPVKYGISLGNDYYSNTRSSFYRGGNTISEAISLEPNVKKSIDMFQKIYSLIEDMGAFEIDPCFSFIGHKNKGRGGVIEKFKNQGRNWIDLKYHLVDVPLEKRWNLEYIRDTKSEEEMTFFVDSYKKSKNIDRYSVVHSYNSNRLPLINPVNKIPFAKIKNYQIFDWLPVLERSSEIYCVDSSLANYVEVCPSLKNNDKFYLGSEEPHYHNYMRNILKNNWTRLDNQ